MENQNEKKQINIAPIPGESRGTAGTRRRTLSTNLKHDCKHRQWTANVTHDRVQKSVDS